MADTRPSYVSRRVLVVEDSASMRELLAEAIRRRGAQVFEAADALEALKQIAQRSFDLFFIDLNIPVMDGTKLIRRLREDVQYAHTPICVVTTELDAASEAHTRSIGATFYLRKPTSRREVEAVLAEAFLR